jgi:hypothetical protein
MGEFQTQIMQMGVAQPFLKGRSQLSFCLQQQSGAIARRPL